MMTWAESPEIDLQGNTNVRLQYQRWLGVEDGAFDNARIMVNGVKMWTNFASPAQTMQGIDHVDKEWRFQDVDLTAQAASGKVKLRFELDSDQGLSYGGWTVDDVCVVSAAPAPSCGNGNLDEGETCDDGNIDDGDGCSPTCSVPGDDTGCCSVGATPGGAALLSLFTIGMLIRRRRR
jgi:MYXO-CTERM domain-containing protein